MANEVLYGVGINLQNSGKVINSPDASDAGDLINLGQVQTLIAAAAIGPVVDPVNAASVAALPAVTYDNGTAGVGATLTADAVGALVVDGVTLTLNQRVLIKDQASAIQNGVYKLTVVGDGSTAFELTRVTDFDTPAEMIAGASMFVLGGTLAGSEWYLSATVSTIGTDNITFAEQGVYTAGNGISITGRAIAVKVDGTTIDFNGSGELEVISTDETGSKGFAFVSGDWSGDDLVIDATALGTALKSAQVVNTSGVEVVLTYGNTSTTEVTIRKDSSLSPFAGTALISAFPV